MLGRNAGLPKQKNSYQSSPTFLCFESPLRYLRSSVIYSVSGVTGLFKEPIPPAVTLCYVKVDFGNVNGIYLHDKPQVPLISKVENQESDEAKRTTLTKTFSNVQINITEFYDVSISHLYLAI